jgi:hypothetical protein
MVITKVHKKVEVLRSAKEKVINGWFRCSSGSGFALDELTSIS